MKRGLYVGSFDPPTCGHSWVIEFGSNLFDELVIGVGVNPSKKNRYMFSMEERVNMLKEITKHMTNVKVLPLGLELAAVFAKTHGCEYLLQGVRDLSDYEAQKAARYKNNDIVRGIATILVIPPRDMVEISSSFVKGMIGFNGWESVVEPCIHPAVLKALKDKQ